MKRKYNIGDIYVNNQGESFKIIKLYRFKTCRDRIFRFSF